MHDRNLKKRWRVPFDFVEDIKLKAMEEQSLELPITSVVSAAIDGTMSEPYPREPLVVKTEEPMEDAGTMDFNR